MIYLIDMALPVAKSIVFALLVAVVGLFFIRYAEKLVGKLIDRKGLDETLKPFVKSIVGVGLKLLLVVAVIGILGIDTTSFVALFGAAGLAVGLAFQGSLSNFAGGVLILVTKPFKVGDYIEAAGFAGTVASVRILYTDLVTPDNKVVRIPNGGLSNAGMVNYSEKETRRVDFKFGVGYDADTTKVIEILTDVAVGHPLALKDPGAFVRMSEHGDSAVFYTVRVWVKSKDYWQVYFDIIEQAKRHLDDAQIPIPYPQMDVHVHQKN
jgi:small conductance mechanosensitive channel